jgi:DNA-binding CsgD family transcriptional regulator
VVFANNVVMSDFAASSEMQALAATTSLTRAEAQVLRLLIAGASTRDIALRRQTSVHTVRSQINSILGKTGCASKLELIGKLHRAKR